MTKAWQSGTALEPRTGRVDKKWLGCSSRADPDFWLFSTLGQPETG